MHSQDIIFKPFSMEGGRTHLCHYVPLEAILEMQFQNKACYSYNPDTWELRREDSEFEGSLDYMEEPCQRRRRKSREGWKEKKGKVWKDVWTPK